LPAIKSQHSRILERLIFDRRQQLIEAVMAGSLPERTYSELIGEARGLDVALRMSEEADFKLSGDFNDDGS
jgi:hypothetical protein